jgi:hypothetical protein
MGNDRVEPNIRCRIPKPNEVDNFPSHGRPTNIVGPCDDANEIVDVYAESGIDKLTRYRLNVCALTFCEPTMPNVKIRQQQRPKLPSATLMPSAITRLLLSGGVPSLVKQQM